MTPADADTSVAAATETTNSRLRRVLMTADTVGGVWAYTLNLAAGLRESGVEVCLATLGSHASPDQVQEVERLDGIRLFESGFALEWMNAPWSDVDASGAWLLELEQQVGADVVHLCSYSHASLPFAAPNLVVCHSCVGSWWKAVRRSEAPPEWDEYRRRVARGLSDAGEVVGPTRAILEEVCRSYGVPTRGVVVNNGIDQNRYYCGTKEPFVLSAGRLWDEAKNLTLLDGCARALDWPVYFAGSNQSPNGQTVATHDAFWLGQLSAEALIPWMARAAVYVMPARYEPFGLSILEAASCGCALVLGDIPTLREIWQEDALYVDPYDASGWPAVINQLCRDSKRLTTMAGRSRERARRFTTKIMTAGYQRIYDDLLRQGAV